MFDLKKFLSPIALAGAVALSPAAASAVTVTQTNVVGDPFVGIATIDVLSGASFNATFEDTDIAGAAKFNLYNSSATTAAVTFVVTTVTQCVLSCGFTGGAFIDLNDNMTFDGAPEIFVSENNGGLGGFTTMFQFLIGAGGTTYFDFIYGDPYANSGAKPEFDFTVEAALVPLPAGGLLLLTALGGLGLARRRRSAEPAIA